MPNFNQLQMMGHLARDPELRFTPNGKAICQLTVCTNYTYKDSEQKKVSIPCFLDWKAWGNTGEVISKHFNKGDAIFLQGRLDQESWTDKETEQKRTKHVGVVERFEFVGGKKE